MSDASWLTSSIPCHDLLVQWSVCMKLEFPLKQDLGPDPRLPLVTLQLITFMKDELLASIAIGPQVMQYTSFADTRVEHLPDHKRPISVLETQDAGQAPRR